MNCEACGHEFWKHGFVGPWDPDLDLALCENCYWEPRGGPCFPWEFR